MWPSDAPISHFISKDTQGANAMREGSRMKAKKQVEPESVLRDGKPAAVILDIDHYRELLERAQDTDDLKALRALRRRPVKFRRLDDFLKSYAPDV